MNSGFVQEGKAYQEAG